MSLIYIPKKFQSREIQLVSFNQLDFSRICDHVDLISLPISETPNHSKSKSNSNQSISHTIHVLVVWFQLLIHLISMSQSIRYVIFFFSKLKDLFWAHGLNLPRRIHRNNPRPGKHKSLWSSPSVGRENLATFACVVPTHNAVKNGFEANYFELWYDLSLSHLSAVSFYYFFE